MPEKITANAHPGLMTARDARALSYARHNKGVEYILAQIRTAAVMADSENPEMMLKVPFSVDRTDTIGKNEFLRCIPTLIILGYEVKLDKDKKRWTIRW